jgi:hypothetical protein
MFMHGCDVGMHAPAHSCLPSPQSPPQLCPSHVAVPPVGEGQASHDVPQ